LCAAKRVPEGRSEERAPERGGKREEGSEGGMGRWAVGGGPEASRKHSPGGAKKHGTTWGDLASKGHEARH
jgi:hypothetical protein